MHANREALALLLKPASPTYTIKHIVTKIVPKRKQKTYKLSKQFDERLHSKSLKYSI